MVHDNFSGWQVYRGGSYHYDPSILINNNQDCLIHMWTCSPGTGSTQWDVIRYHYSNDNGQTWSLDETALKPISCSHDTYSACDPDVVKIDKYYYIGYTSTTNLNATQNQLFLALSLIPNGN
ncbi:unnamed protein product [Rotaria sordida]|uniref:Exo-alpha-sialidase n=1 Tax=Rotaria sordida TaxID=392033 RepID=A0A819MWH6_9BILA|nr:unnamed protein product [Rotaria sordida]